MKLNTPNISTAEAKRILSRRFPTPEELSRFPFGSLLQRLCKRRDGEGKDFIDHAPAVLKAMNILLGKTPWDLIGDIGEGDKKNFLKVRTQIGHLFDAFDQNAKFLFRLAALYHDIGKYIIKERHPTVGWYTLEYLEQNHREALRTLLGGREDYLQLLLIMIRDHDEFGVLSTGEASYPILLRPINSLGDDPFDQKRIISAIMWLNLADMAGTPGLFLKADDLRKVLEDWQWFIDALKHCSDGKDSLNNYVIEQAAHEKKVIIRICRLLLEASRNVPSRIAEFHAPSVPGHSGNRKKANAGTREPVDPLEEMKIFQLVRKQLEAVYDTSIPRQEFETHFTYICKLDYGKRFFIRLVEYYEGPHKNKHKSQKSFSKRIDTVDLIYAVLAILRKITSTFSSMENIVDGRGNLIGVEMKDLTPRNAPEKTAQIIELLRKSHYPGLAWMMSDCLAWYF